MNCPWHPSKRVVASCKDCGTGFCIECVRETDQTTLCPDCFRRKIGEIAREFTEPAESKDKRRAVAKPALPEEKQPQQAQPAPTFEEETRPAVAPAASRVKKGIGGRRDRSKGERPSSEPVAMTQDDFLSQGPDDDFSQLGVDTAKPGRWSRKAKKAEAAPAAEGVKTPQAGGGAAEAVEMPRVVEEAEETRPTEKVTTAAEASGRPSEDSLLQDVMSTLLKPEAGSAEMQNAVPETQVAEAPVEAAPAKFKARKEKVKVREKEAKAPKERDMERWSFLSQPRSSEYTLIAVSWWRAAIFVALMLLLGAVLWAVPNAYLIPKDQEYGVHAVVIGLIIGLAFWWKAGRKHSTKLAVQAALTTLFALFIGEFLHWFLIITKYQAFRTIFFDLISFKFLWENGADILRYTVEAMFPIAFLWLLFLPTVTAFIIGFGMPPIPEIFIQIWHALKGQAPEEKEASHGLEG